MNTSRITGIVTIITGVLAIALLLNHPGGQVADFAGLLKQEAANRIIDGVVHGGFILVLAIQLACYAIFSGRLGWTKPFAVAGMAFFAVGAGLQMAALLVDGLMIPAMAARYVAAPPDRLPYARSLFVLCSIAIQFLMPMGLFFQGAGVTAWGTALAGLTRGTGIAAAAAGILVAIAAIAAFMTGVTHLLLVAIALLVLWAIMAGVSMLRGRV